MTARMRAFLGAMVVVSACTGGDDGAAFDATAARTYAFGPFDIAPGQEINDQCIQISLGNPEPIFVNQIELTTGPGFHHSNWLWVPAHIFPGDDGTYTCDDRGFDQGVAAVFGNVVFAQSTQNPHEIQRFPQNAALKIPANAKLVSNIHLLNPREETLSVAPTIKLTPIAEDEVSTVLSGISFENQALAIPGNNATSRFITECDLSERHTALLGTNPDFNLYYALAHYHELATGLTIEAVRPDGSATTVFTTTQAVGDSLGGPIDPLFSMQGYTKLRMSCDFKNPRPSTVRWGVGDQEMCVFLAFSDSPYNWGGGIHSRSAPENPQMVGTTMTYTNACQLLVIDGTH